MLKLENYVLQRGAFRLLNEDELDHLEQFKLEIAEELDVPYEGIKFTLVPRAQSEYELHGIWDVYEAIFAYLYKVGYPVSDIVRHMREENVVFEGTFLTMQAQVRFYQKKG